jgi:hypothetical protein
VAAAERLLDLIDVERDMSLQLGKLFLEPLEMCNCIGEARGGRCRTRWGGYSSGQIVQAVGANLCVERLGCVGRLEIELLAERGGAVLVLAQRGGSVARDVVEPHQAAVCLLAGAIVPQCARTVAQALLAVPAHLAVAHQLVEQRR